MKHTGRFVLAGLALSLLTACGGRSVPDSARNPAYYRTSQISASGPISQACLRSGRDAANTRLCSCVQGTANQTLSRSDQDLAASFYRDPQRAQQIRQSNSSRNQAFWRRYTTYATRAEEVCAGPLI